MGGPIITDEQVIEITKRQLDRIEGTLKKMSPYWFITEEDLRAYLWSLFDRDRLLKPRAYHDQNYRIHLVHGEYPRLNKNKTKRMGRYDLAILDPSRLEEVEEDDKKPILLGIELYSAWNAGPSHILEKFKNDSGAFGKPYYAKRGLIIVVNQGRSLKAKDVMGELEKEIKKLKRKYRHVSFYYIESFKKSEGKWDTRKIWVK